MRIFIRSVLFYLYFLCFLFLLGPFLLASSYIICDRRLSQCLSKIWGQLVLIAAKRCVGISYQLKGFEKIHQSPVPLIIASKHQSLWETAVLQMEFGEKSVFVVKKELKSVPFFGRMFALTGAIAIDRKKPVHAIRQMLTEAKNEVENNKSNIIIFPEGRRTAVGERADYTDGVYLLYKNLNMPVAAVAVNSGLYWPRRGFLKYPGIIEAKVMEIIPPGLDRDQFRDRLVHAIESGSLELIKSHTRHEHEDVQVVEKKKEVVV